MPCCHRNDCDTFKSADHVSYACTKSVLVIAGLIADRDAELLRRLAQ